METLMHLTSSNGKKLMLRITTQKKRGKTLLSIEGRLAGPLVGTLEQCWRELRAAAPGEKLHLRSSASQRNRISVLQLRCGFLFRGSPQLAAILKTLGARKK